MSTEAHQKVSASHLKRNAYLYVRQSTLRQVFENTESTKRQYALRQRAIALGWPAEQIVVIDTDLGQSGASAADREGFQRLVSEVGLGRAGIVLGLEVSRLARNSSDWHRLLEICALTSTLILDEDGLYDPCHFNDRLLLGLKGTMSEAELHVLRARLRGGVESKARRGELKSPLPIGLAYDHVDRVVLDPDRQVQDTLRTFFKTFEEVGSAVGLVKRFRKEGWPFPRRLRRGVRREEVVWGELVHSRALQLLHNPRYAGAFVFGRTRRSKILCQSDWHTLILDAHPGYIRWEQFQRNRQRLRDNSQAHGGDRRKSPPGEGPALLQGIAVCGVCGQRMTVRYHCRRGRLVPDYVCQRSGIEHARRICQQVPGANIDQAIGQLLVSKVTPLALEVSLAVQQELLTRQKEADLLRRRQVERARYEADLARQRYMQVDPRNRLVADNLEAEWNEKLRAVSDAEELYDRDRRADALGVDEKTRSEILDVAKDFSKLWNDPHVSDRDRKRIVRLLIEDVTLLRNGRVTSHVRFKGGVCQTLELPRSLNAWESRKTSDSVREAVDRLLNDYTDVQVAAKLNERGLRSGTGSAFTPRIVYGIRKKYHLKSRYERLREAGMLTTREMARKLAVHWSTVKTWRDHGLLRAYVYNRKCECLYEPPDAEQPMKQQGQKLSERRRFPQPIVDLTDEVQHEA